MVSELLEGAVSEAPLKLGRSGLINIFRYVLNYKRLPYETVYVSYPDISKLWRELGLSPLAGPGPSTILPVISVPSTDGGPPSVIADSFNIAL
jgi:hypothetical protein